MTVATIAVGAPREQLVPGATVAEAGRGAPAPGRLALVQRFINSIDIDRRADLWSSPAALAAWIEGEGWPPLPGLDRADLRHCVEVREALRELLLANAGAALDPAALAALNRAAGGAAVLFAFDSVGTATVRPASGGVDRALGDVLAAVVVAQAEGTWGRLKACREDTCLRAFFDYSKNGSGTWCSMAICGNRAKARRYRARRRAGGAQ